MGLKFEKNQKSKKEESHQVKGEDDDEESNNNHDQSTQEQGANQTNQFLVFIKKNIKTIFLIALVILVLVLVISLVGDQLKSYLKEKLSEYKDASLTGIIILTLVGTIMVLTGAPILFFELSLGCVLQSYLIAVLIASLSKLFGVVISYQITKRLLMNYILRKFGDNLYLRLLRRMSRNQPAKAIAMLAIIQIPMLIKNYSLPLFEVGIKYIIFVFCSIQILQSSLFCFIGSTLTPTQSGNVDAEGSIVKDIFTYLSYLVTIIAFYMIYKETQKLKKQSESENFSFFDQENNLKDVEMQQKISYMSSQELQKNHQIKLVYPKINQDE